MRAGALALFTLGAVSLLAACDDGAGFDPLLGVACASTADCGELACMADRAAVPGDLEPEPLACGVLSAGRSPGEPCANADDCAHGLCLLAGACAEPCVSSNDCGQAQHCQAVFARRGEDLLTALSACVTAVVVPADVEHARELGASVREGDNAVELAPVPVDATTLVVLDHASPGWPSTVFCRPPLCVQQLRAQDEVLFRADACMTGDALRVPVATGDHIDPVVFRFDPAAARFGVASGFVATIEAEAAGGVTVTTLSNRARRQRLDLHLFYVGAAELLPQGSRGPALIADALEVVDEIFAQADIFIGEVQQTRVGGGLPERGIAFVDGDQAQGFARLRVRYGVHAELPYLFRLSAGSPHPAVNVFFVGDIEPRGSGELEAIAGGIPGPLGLHGTGGSGIVVAANMMAGDPTGLGRTLAHELGHYLGLFHTSERDGCVREALSDTPECTAEHDLAGDGLDASDCQGRGAENLMFFAKTSGTELTPQQIEVLRTALILQ